MAGTEDLYELKTERLFIRRVARDDWPAFAEIWSDQAASDYACFDHPSDTDPVRVRERIETWSMFAVSTEHMFFAVCLLDKVIGFFAFNRRERGYEIGYCFHSAFHKKGYALEALSALTAHITEAGLAEHFEAGTALENAPSVKLLLAAGFRQTGTESVSFYRDTEGNDIWFEGGIFELEMKERNNGICHKDV